MDVLIYQLIHSLLLPLTFTLVLLILFLIFNKLNHDLFNPKFEKIKAKIDNFLTGLVFSDFDETSFVEQINAFKKEIPFEKRWCKKLVLDEIIFMKSNLKGEVTTTFHFIYEKFNLFEYTKKLLNSDKFYLQCMGLFQIQVLEFKEGISYIEQLRNHQKENVRFSAFASLISLYPDELGSLYDFKGNINIADEINIMDILHQKKTKMPENLPLWIQSDNLSIVKLGIKLMSFYNFTQEKETLIQLIKHPDRSVGSEAIMACNLLFIFEAEHALIEQFQYENTINKLEILQTLSKIGMTASETFIYDLLKNKEVESIKLDAIYCLYKINPHYFEDHFLGDEDIQKMLKHVKNPYI